jgi:hypothetical protein
MQNTPTLPTPPNTGTFGPSRLRVVFERLEVGAMNLAWDRMYLDFSQKRQKIVKLLAGAVPFLVVSVPKLG